MTHMNVIAYSGDEMPSLRIATQQKEVVTAMIFRINEAVAKYHTAKSMLQNHQLWDSILDAQKRATERRYWLLVGASALVGCALAGKAAKSARNDLKHYLRDLYSDITTRPSTTYPEVTRRLAKNNYVVLQAFLRFTVNHESRGVGFSDPIAKVCMEAIDHAPLAFKAGSLDWFKRSGESASVNAFNPDKFLFIPQELIGRQSVAERNSLSQLEQVMIDAREAHRQAVQVVRDSRALSELNEEQYLRRYEGAKSDQERQKLKASQDDKRGGIAGRLIEATLSEQRCQKAAWRLQAAITEIIEPLRPMLGVCYPGELMLLAKVSNCLAAHALIADLASQRRLLDKLLKNRDGTPGTLGDFCEETLDDLVQGKASLPDDFAQSRYGWSLDRYPSERNG